MSSSWVWLWDPQGITVAPQSVPPDGPAGSHSLLLLFACISVLVLVPQKKGGLVKEAACV